MTEPASTIQDVPLSKLTLSPTSSQAIRRERYDQTALDELAQSLTELGQLQPIVARKQGAKFEIVAGERRFEAAKRAGLATLSVSVRDLNDQQAIEAQLVENLQREGLHELAEAEGYETLMKEHGFSAEDLVVKTGKSRSYVYGRVKLLSLCDEARESFRSGKISASIALLLARMPVEKLQKSALREIENGGSWRPGGERDPMTYRQAKDHVQDRYMLLLSEASFSSRSATLLPEAGACTKCPKRTGNQPDLFSDIQSTDVCTDPKCFADKELANVEQRFEKAEKAGQKIARGRRRSRIHRRLGAVERRVREAQRISLPAHQ